MSLFDIRKQLIDETGRFDLVTSPTTYVDNGANFHVRAGSRILDGIQDSPKSVATLRKDLAVGDSSILLKNNRSIEGVWITDGSAVVGDDNGRTKLTKVSRDWFLSNFKTPVSAITAGRPLYWIPSLIGLAPEQSRVQPAVVADSPEMLKNGGFDSPYFWTMGSTEFNITGGTLVSTVTAATTATSDDMRLIPGRVYQVVYTVSGRTQGTITPSLGGGNGSAQITNATFTDNITAGSTNKALIFTTDTTFDGSIDDVSVKEVITLPYTDELTYDFEELSLGDNHWGKTGIMFLPPTDVIYTITVKGRWWSRPLYNDSDENFWSFNHPDLLVLATMLSLEKFRRNTQGVNDMRKAIDEQLLAISRDESSNDIAEVDFLSDRLVTRL